MPALSGLKDILVGEDPLNVEMFWEEYASARSGLGAMGRRSRRSPQVISRCGISPVRRWASRCMVQAIRIGACALVGVPIEPFAAIGA
jgi:hypothetical protein